MAQPIEYTKIDPVKSYLVSISSRYAGNPVVYWGTDRRLTFTTYIKTPYKPSSSDKYAVIPAGMEYRPDLVSQQAYGVPDFWYKIMEANNMIDIMEFKTGTNIVIPVAAF